jgi:hypothetical protein
VPPVTKGVPIYIHDYYGEGRHAKVVAATAKDLMEDGEKYVSQPPLTGNEARVAEVSEAAWPKLLDPVDDLPPATIVTSVRREGTRLTITGVSHDNGEITEVRVNGTPAEVLASGAGVVDWQIVLETPASGLIEARAADKSGNVEQMPHRINLGAAAE